MKKSLVLVIALAAIVAFAGTSLAASWECLQAPAYCKAPVCKDQVLCKGKAKGKTPLCGPGAPALKWEVKWLTLSLCPGSKMLKK